MPPVSITSDSATSLSVEWLFPRSLQGLDTQADSEHQTSAASTFPASSLNQRLRAHIPRILAEVQSSRLEPTPRIEMQSSSSNTCSTTSTSSASIDEPRLKLRDQSSVQGNSPHCAPALSESPNAPGGFGEHDVPEIRALDVSTLYRWGGSRGAAQMPSHLRPSCERSSSDTISENSNPLLTNESISEWSDDTQDTALAQLVTVSSRLLLDVYLNALIRGRSPQSGRAASNRSGSTAESSSGQQSSLHTSSKRKRKQPELDESTDRSGSVRVTKHRKNASCFEERLLACPFNKFDNILFGQDSHDESYRSCATCAFVNIAYLK